MLHKLFHVIILLNVCLNAHFDSTTLITVVSWHGCYLILWLYTLSLLRFAMCFCCNFLIITWLSSIRSDIKLARFVWKLTFYVIEIWGHSRWHTKIILSPPPLVFTGNSVPVHKFNNLCDGRVRYMDVALPFPRSLRLSSSIPICIFLNNKISNRQ